MEKAKAREENVVRAERLEIIDSRGRVRAVIGDVGGPSIYAPGVTLLDRHGRQRCWWALFREGPNMTFESDGNERLLFGVDDGDTGVGDDDADYDPTAYVVIAEASGAPTTHIRVHADGSVEIRPRAIHDQSDGNE